MTWDITKLIINFKFFLNHFRSLDLFLYLFSQKTNSSFPRELKFQLPWSFPETGIPTLVLTYIFYLPESNLELPPAGWEDGEEEDVVREGDEASST